MGTGHPRPRRQWPAAAGRRQARVRRACRCWARERAAHFQRHGTPSPTAAPAPCALPQPQRAKEKKNGAKKKKKKTGGGLGKKRKETNLFFICECMVLFSMPAFVFLAHNTHHPPLSAWKPLGRVYHNVFANQPVSNGPPCFFFFFFSSFFFFFFFAFARHAAAHECVNVRTYNSMWCA